MTDGVVTAATAAAELVEEDVLEITAPRATDEVVVLDYGGQYSQLIARRVRELGVFSELLPHHVGAAEVRKRKPKGLILSGGPASVYAPGAPRLDRKLLELGIPVLGIGVPQATAIADVAGARSQHMLETGEYCQVVADGGMRNGGDCSKAIACGTPIPRTPRVVQAAPGPTPTSTPAAPVRMRCRAVW